MSTSEIVAAPAPDDPALQVKHAGDVDDDDKVAFLSIVAANSTAQITERVFRYLVNRLSKEELGEQTGAEIVALHRRLRDCGSAIRCVARSVAPDDIYVARTHRNEPREYYLQLVADSEAFRAVLSEEQMTAEQNEQRLASCGLRIVDEQRRRANDAGLKLPVDLSDERRERFLQQSNVEWLGIDDALSVAQLTAHSDAALQGTVSGDLDGSGAIALRTAVPADKWSETRAFLRRDIAQRLPFARSHVVARVYDDLLPIGYHALGTTLKSMYHVAPANTQEVQLFDAAQTSGEESQQSEEGKPFVLFDIYAYAVRRYVIDYDDIDVQLLQQWLGTLQGDQCGAQQQASDDVNSSAKLRKQLADKAMCEYELVDAIDSRDAFLRQFAPLPNMLLCEDVTTCVETQ